MYQFKKNTNKPGNSTLSSKNRPAAPKKKKDISRELESLMNLKTTDSPAPVEDYKPINAINELPVNEKLIKNIKARKFTNLTEIQDKCFQSILEGKNLMGIAQTGTGKTAAFLIPIIHNLIGKMAGNQVNIILPTRELAVQVNEEFMSLSAGTGLSSICLIGGTSLNRNISDLRKKYHLVIGTPGRLKDLRNQRVLNYSNFEIAVLDEFDRLLDMGFQKDILSLIGTMTSRKQTILLSATEEPEQQRVIDQILHNPVKVRVSNGKTSSESVEQTTVKIAEGQDKFTVLVEMLKKEEFEKVLVFIETKHNVAKIWKKLRALGIDASQIHGNVSQNKRLSAISDFKEGRSRVLLATDIAARGLDICEVSHVINYEVPRTKDSYIHRVGRTGRAGNTGKALTFIS